VGGAAVKTTEGFWKKKNAGGKEPTFQKKSPRATVASRDARKVGKVAGGEELKNSLAEPLPAQKTPVPGRSIGPSAEQQEKLKGRA